MKRNKKFSFIASGLGEAHWIFAVAGSIFGLALLLVIPPMWGLDEPAHVERVYQIVHGDIFPDRGVQYGGTAPTNLVDLGNVSHDDLANNRSTSILNRKDADGIDTYKKYLDQPFSKSETPTPTAASYSPFAYLGPIVGVYVADLFNANVGMTLYLARIFSLISYVLLGWLTLRLLRTSKIRWLFMVTLLLPTSLFQGSVVSADGALISFSLLLFALFVKLYDSNSKDNRKMLFYYLLTVAILLPLAKINYIFLSTLVLFVPNNIFSKVKLSMAVKLASVIAIGLFVYAWSAITKATSDAPFTQRSDGLAVSASNQLAYMINHPLHFIEATMRSIINYGDVFMSTATSLIGWNSVVSPLLFIFLSYVALIIAGLFAKNEIRNIKKAFAPIGIITLLGILSVFASMYLVFNPVGSNIVDGVQGRYFIPFIVPIIVLISYYAPIDLKMSKVPLTLTAVSCLVLFVSTLLYYVQTY